MFIIQRSVQWEGCACFAPTEIVQPYENLITFGKAARYIIIIMVLFISQQVLFNGVVSTKTINSNICNMIKAVILKLFI